MKDGPYFYFHTPSRPRVLVEVWAKHVAEVGEEGWRPIRLYTGVFIPLVEAAPLPAPIDYETPVVVYPPVPVVEATPLQVAEAAPVEVES